MKLGRQEREAYRLDGVMVLSTTDLRLIVTALREQLEREKRRLAFVSQAAQPADRPRLKRRLEEQRQTVERYEQLLRRVVGQL